MTSEVESKKGGPYTKEKQEKRRNQVYELHFEKGYSGRKIADMLKINRNTINEDIQFLYTESGKALPEITEALIVKLLERLEGQHARLQDELEKQEDFQKRIVIEKMLLAVNGKIAQLLVKCSTQNWDVLARVRNLGW